MTWEGVWHIFQRGITSERLGLGASFWCVIIYLNLHHLPCYTCMYIMLAAGLLKVVVLGAISKKSHSKCVLNLSLR